MDVLFSPQLCPDHPEGPSSSSDTDPLLMARPTHHVIDITPNSQPSTSSSSSSPHASRLVVSSSENSNGSNSRMRVRHGEQRTIRSPLNSGFLISVEAFLTLSQIVASVVVLALSRHEHTRAPLFAWIVGYASGCVATLPMLLWRYYYNNRVRDMDSAQASPRNRIHDTSGTLLDTSGTNEGEEVWSAAAAAESHRRSRGSWLMNPRMKLLMEYFKISIDCFFAIWFVVGNVWIFGGHASASEAPNMYRLCVVFLTLSCIGYAMPFILCATICCCLPCLVSILGIREVLTETQGATSETIDALPTYKFKRKKSKSTDEGDSPSSEGGIVAAGTEKERTISREDAVCCICLATYENNDELRELPCSHFFHKDCVDKWLKINASCPLCKSVIGENITGSVSGEHATQQQSDRRIENGPTNTSY